MKRKARGFVAFCVSAGLAAVLLVRLVSGGTATPDLAERTGGTGVVAVAEWFTIAGDAAAPMLPGIMTPLDLSITNPSEAMVSVTQLSVTLGDLSAPNADGAHPCTADDFTVEQASDSLGITVAGQSTSSLSGLGLAPETWPRAGMLDRPVNQDGCKGAVLTLDYTALGTTGG